VNVASKNAVNTSHTHHHYKAINITSSWCTTWLMFSFTATRHQPCR